MGWRKERIKEESKIKTIKIDAIMNENLNLVEILKDCPKGTKLYSPLFGEVELDEIYINSNHPIKILVDEWLDESFTKDGRLFYDYAGECVLFPSKEQRDWSKFKPKKPKFDPKTLQAFDRVLVRDSSTGPWRCEFFSHIKKDSPIYPYLGVSAAYICCIPYNDDTKHLVGTSEEAPDYYKY